MVRPQTRLGTKPGVPIEDLNGASVFVQRQGKSLNAFQYGDDIPRSYQVQQVSVLSSHLIKNPVDLAARRSTSTDEADTLFLVNGDDGSMTVYSLLVGQNVIAPSKFTTDGEFIAVAVEVSDVYVIVKRTIGGTDNYILEKFNPDLTVDSGKSGGAAASVTMDHLEGKEVDIIRDGIVEATQTVPATPFTITFDRAATTDYQVGLDYTITVKTMPTEPTLQSGSVQGVRKRIVQVDAIVNQTKDLVINGKQISFRNFGPGVLGQAVQPFTGVKTAHGILGYSATGQITLTQTVPLPMTVLGLEYKMSVGN